MKGARRNVEGRFARAPLIGSFAYAISREPQAIGAWSSGSVGERAVGERLDSLSRSGVMVLHDRRIPRRTSNIDHIAVGPSGVFVIDTKRYQGARVKKAYLGPIWNPGPAQLMVQGRTARIRGQDAPSERSGLPCPRRVERCRCGVQGREDHENARVHRFRRGASSLRRSRWTGIRIGTPKQMAKVVSRPGPLDPDTVQSIAEVSRRKPEARLYPTGPLLSGPCQRRRVERLRLHICQRSTSRPPVGRRRTEAIPTGARRARRRCGQAPDLLDGWSVGHVITHVARNADSHTRRVEAAKRDEIVDQYAGGYEGRAAEIEIGAGRSAAELVQDVTESAELLEESWGSLSKVVWAREVSDVAGRTHLLSNMPSRRWRELEIHLVDLDIGPTWRAPGPTSSSL